jgi:Family of unknown function (DUF6941)
MPDETMMRPFIQVAAICQMPLLEQGGALSVIRIIDRIPVRGASDVMQPQSLSQLNMVVVLKSGPMRGKFKWNIVAVTPSQKQIPGPEMNALFDGEERGVALVQPLELIAEEEGLYWFDVMLEGQLLTRIPLRVMYEQLRPMRGMHFPQQGS